MPSHEHPTASNWLELVKEKAAAIRFGTINITVHEGRVTIVEAVQKTRVIPDTPSKTDRSPQSGAPQ